VTALLAKAPGDRPADAAAVVAALESLPVSGAHRARRTWRRGRMAAGLLVVAMAGAGAWYGLAARNPQTLPTGGLEVAEIRFDTLPLVVRPFVNNTENAALDAPLARARDAALRDLAARQVTQVVLYAPADAPRGDSVRVTVSLERDSVAYWMRVRVDGREAEEPLWDFITLHHPIGRVDAVLDEGASRVAGWALSLREVPPLMYYELDGRLYRLPPRLDAFEGFKAYRETAGSFEMTGEQAQARTRDPRWLAGYLFAGVDKTLAVDDSVLAREPLIAALARSDYAPETARNALIPIVRRGFPWAREGMALYDIILGRPQEALSLVSGQIAPAVTMDAFIALGDAAAADSVFRVHRPTDDFGLHAAAFAAGARGDSAAVLRIVAQRANESVNALRDLVAAGTEFFARGDITLAASTIRRGLAIVPQRDPTNSAGSFQSRARLHRMLGELDRAQEWLSLARARERTLSDTENTLTEEALLRVARGDSSGARALSDSLETAGAVNVDVLVRLHAALGQRDQALAILQREGLHGSGVNSVRHDYDLLPLRAWPPLIAHFRPRDDDRPVRFVRSRGPAR
jgi:hypothetical protein